MSDTYVLVHGAWHTGHELEIYRRDVVGFGRGSFANHAGAALQQ